MSEKKKKGGLLSQILVAVVIALLAGGTAPWWWNEVKDVFGKMGRDEHVEPSPAVSPVDALKKALEDFDAVQALYSKSKSAVTCVNFRRIIEEVRVYMGNQRLVPESFRYSVRYPSQKPSPTISDLVTDRIYRIKQMKPQCFGS